MSLLLTIIAANSISSEAAHSTLATVSEVDLKRYMGTWYEIARLPNSFQKKCSGNVSASYASIDSDTIEVTNRCKKVSGGCAESKGRARKAVSNGPNSKLKVTFAPSWLSWLGFVWGNYWILELAPDYSYSVVGEPTFKYLWVLSRTKTMDKIVLEGILERAKQKGFDTSKVIMTVQDQDNMR